jgi:hypothetical protein
MRDEKGLNELFIHPSSLRPHPLDKEQEIRDEQGKI